MTPETAAEIAAHFRVAWALKHARLRIVRALRRRGGG